MSRNPHNNRSLSGCHCCGNIPWNGFGISATPRGFTLVELLVVLAIIVVVMAFAMPATDTVLRGSQLTQGSQLISNQLDMARQTAISSNRSVEVRFYQFGDPQTPGEQVAKPETGKFRAMQVFQIQESGTTLPLGKVQILPQSIIIDAGASNLNQTVSSIISASTSTSPPIAATGAALKVPIPRVGTQYNSVAFRFMPDGSTNLSPLSPPGPWFLTLHNINDGDKLGTPLPKNFYAIQIDATNGHIKNFQP